MLFDSVPCNLGVGNHKFYSEQCSNPYLKIRLHPAFSGVHSFFVVCLFIFARELSWDLMMWGGVVKSSTDYFLSLDLTASEVFMASRPFSDFLRDTKGKVFCSCLNLSVSVKK